IERNLDQGSLCRDPGLTGLPEALNRHRSGSSNMLKSFWLVAAAAALAVGVTASEVGAQAGSSAPSATAETLQIETRYYTLPNGLKVVMSREPSVPTATVGVYYGIGFRIEPRDRTGFAHLFEHLMFQ